MFRRRWIRDIFVCWGREKLVEITSPLWAKGPVFSEPLTLLCWPVWSLHCYPTEQGVPKEGHFLFPSQHASLNVESGRGAEKFQATPYPEEGWRVFSSGCPCGSGEKWKPQNSLELFHWLKLISTHTYSPQWMCTIECVCVQLNHFAEHLKLTQRCNQLYFNIR